METKLLTIRDVAGYLQLSEQTIQRYVLNRGIPFHKVKKMIRFRLSEIEEWVNGGGACPEHPVHGGEDDLCGPPAADSLGVCGANSGGNGGTGADGEAGGKGNAGGAV
jgi:excisionase family DNA binding protein